MSRDRARRRAEREAAAAEERVRRAAQREAAERRATRRSRVTGWASALPSPVRTRRPRGLLAARNRRRLWLLLGVIAGIQLLTWPWLPGWPARLLLLAGCLLLLPVLWTLAFDRR